MKKSLIVLMALVAMMSVTLFGCAAEEKPEAVTPEAGETTTPEVEEPTTEPEAGDAEEYHFGYIAYNMADIWNQYSADAFVYAGTQTEVPVKVTVLDSNNSLESSVQAMETLIQQGVDGISVSPINPDQATQLIKMANEAGIPITIENQEPADTEGDYISTIACVYDNIGEAAMHYIAEQKPGAKVFFCAGGVGGGVYETYQVGVDRALADLDGAIEIVGTEHGD